MSESANCEEQREEQTELEEAGGAEVGLSKTVIVCFPHCVATLVTALPRCYLALPCPYVYHIASHL